jgi:hypothetical protein
MRRRGKQESDTDHQRDKRDQSDDNIPNHVLNHPPRDKMRTLSGAYDVS